MGFCSYTYHMELISRHFMNINEIFHSKIEPQFADLLGPASLRPFECTIRTVSTQELRATYILFSIEEEYSLEQFKEYIQHSPEYLAIDDVIQQVKHLEALLAQMIHAEHFKQWKLQRLQIASGITLLLLMKERVNLHLVTTPEIEYLRSLLNSEPFQEAIRIQYLD
ncbi:hypothetical protein BWI97_26000 [Siphonobacter sp. BAB-5405]|nr:hypothetical protein BWI97_26000 [Siphonobacter sp. BAB-5405]